ncbi:MAG: prepilin-type N-terminal cleavage/methylation domain-containing protein [Deltaproteobacteria bacterium]|nr:prepilin-type N-terminal cleavage/methylation domain-containing protein [Deltaproteobacteria bacterium]
MGTRRGRGFTLVELILTIGVLAVIALVVGRMLLVGLDTYAAVTQRNIAITQARTTADRFLGEMVRLTSANILGISGTKLDFRDRFGTVTSFAQGANGAQATVMRGNDVLVSSAGFLQFRYYDGLGVEVATPEAVRRISIDLNVVSPGGYGAMTYHTEIFPRTFMYLGFTDL